MTQDDAHRGTPDPPPPDSGETQRYPDRPPLPSYGAHGSTAGNQAADAAGQQGSGTQPGYGPPPGDGSQPAYGSPPGYGVPGYGPPARYGVPGDGPAPGGGLPG